MRAVDTACPGPRLSESPCATKEAELDVCDHPYLPNHIIHKHSLSDKPSEACAGTLQLWCCKRPKFGQRFQPDSRVPRTGGRRVFVCICFFVNAFVVIATAEERKTLSTVFRLTFQGLIANIWLLLSILFTTVVYGNFNSFICLFVCLYTFVRLIYDITGSLLHKIAS